MVCYSPFLLRWWVLTSRWTQSKECLSSFHLYGNITEHNKIKQQITETVANYSEQQTLVKHKSWILTAGNEQKPNQTVQKDAQRVVCMLDNIGSIDLLEGSRHHKQRHILPTWLHMLSHHCVPGLGRLYSTQRSGVSFQASRYSPRHHHGLFERSLSELWKLGKGQQNGDIKRSRSICTKVIHIGSMWRRTFDDHPECGLKWTMGRAMNRHPIGANLQPRPKHSLSILPHQQPSNSSHNTSLVRPHPSSLTHPALLCNIHDHLEPNWTRPS